MGDIHHQHGAHFIGDLPEFLEINGSCIGRCARHDHLRLTFQRDLTYIIIVKKSLVVDPVRYTLKILAGHIDR